MKSRRWKRWLHALWIAPLALIALAGIALLVADTDAGRDFLRREVLDFVNRDVLIGKLDIASIDGSLFSELHVRGITLDDAEKKRVVELEELHLAYRPGALIHRRIRIDALELVRPVVHALDPTKLLKPTEHEHEHTHEHEHDSAGEATALEIEVARVSIEHGELVLAEVLPIDLVATATISTSGGPLIAAELELHAGRAELRVERLAIDLAKKIAPRGRVHLDVPADLVRAFAADPALSLDVRLDANLSKGSTLPWRVDLDGAISGAALSGSLDADLDRLDAALRLRDFDPQRVHASAPKGALALIIDAHREAADMITRLELNGDLELNGETLHIAPLIARAKLDGAKLDAATRLDVVTAKKDELRVRGAASLELGSVLEVRSSSAAIVIVSAKTFAPIEADLTIDARAAGPVNDLAASLAVRGSSIAAANARLDRLTLDAELNHLPAAASGRAKLQLFGLDAGAAGIAFTDAHATVKLAGGRSAAIDLRANGPRFLRALALSATATASETGAAIDIAQLTAVTSSATWAMHDARIVFAKDGPLSIERFALASEAGAIRAEGTLDPRQLRAQPAELTLAIEQLELGAFAGFAPALRGLAGRIDLSASLHNTAANVSAQIALDAHGLRRKKTLPLDAHVHATLDRQALTASITAGGPEIGSLVINANGRAPFDPFDQDAWTKEGRLDALSADIPGLDLSRLVAFTSTSIGLSGRVSGHAQIGRELRTADVELAVKKLEAPALALPADLEVKLALGPEQCSGKVIAGFKNAPVMNIVFDSTAGSDALRRLGIKALEQQGAELHLAAENVPAELIAVLARLDPHDPRFDAPRGRASLWVDAKGAPPDVKVTVRAEAEHFALAKRAPELALDLSADVGGGRLTSTAHAHFPGERGGASLNVEAAVPKLADIDAWKKLDPRALRALQINVDAFLLQTIAELTFAKVPHGKIDVKLALDSELSGGRSEVVVRDLRLSPDLVPLDVALSGRFGTRAQTVSATISAGGAHVLELAAELDAGLEALAFGKAPDPRFRATARVPKLPLDQLLAKQAMKRAIRGALDVTVLTSGRLSAPTSSVSFALEDAKLGGVDFDNFSGKASMNKDGVNALLELAARGGSLAVHAKAPKGGRAQAIVDAKAFGLAFLGGLAKTLGGSAIGIDGTLDGRSEVVIGERALDLRGHLEIGSMRLVLPGAPSIEHGKLAIELDGNRAKLGLTGEIGKGALDLKLAFFAPTLSDFDLDGELSVDDMHYDANGTVVAVDSSIKLGARRRGKETNASVIIGATEVTLPSEKGRALYTIRDFEDVHFVEHLHEALPEEEQTATSTAIDPSKLAVKIATDRPIVARGGENALEIGVDLAFNAEGAKKKLTGKVEIEQGRVSIVGKAYNFQRGLVRFDGSFPPDPKLDLRLAHEFPSLVLLVLVQGTGKKPEIRFASEPGGYDQATLLGYFVGAGPGESGEGSAEDKAKRAASGLLVSQLAGAAKEEVPIDTLDVDLGDGAARSGSVSAGKWVTGDVFIAYRYRFTPPEHENQSEGILRWRFARGWTLEARFGDHSEGSLDAVWLKRF